MSVIFNGNYISNRYSIWDRYNKKDFEESIQAIKDANRILNIRNISNELSRQKGNTKTKKETPKYVKDFIKCIK